VSDMLNVGLLKLKKQSNHIKLLIMIMKNNQCLYLTRA